MPETKSRIHFDDQIRRNKIKSFFLILIVFAVLIVLSYVIGLIFSDFFFVILIFGIIISISYILISYYNSDKIALMSVGAKPADYNSYRQYHHIVEGLCLASGMPKPKLYVMHNNQINAFASGRSPKNSVICMTDGALEKLNKQELEGVIGHELSHIANYDIRFITLTAVLVGLIAIISQLFLRSLFYGGGNRDREGKGQVLLLVIGIALAILAPIVVQLVQFAISRKREFMADASSVKFTRTNTGLISALKKIKTDSSAMKVSGAVAPLFIANPLKKIGGLFQTHPSIEKRIEVLGRM